PRSLATRPGRMAGSVGGEGADLVDRAGRVVPTVGRGPGRRLRARGVGDFPTSGGHASCGSAGPGPFLSALGSGLRARARGRFSAMAIRVLVTGGTFDKEYDELGGKLFFRDTHLHEMLKLGRCHLDLTVRTVMMIDSLDMSDADRGVILETCREAPESQIVITHGTDTMVETAQILALGLSGKTIVLTGAMIPWAFGSSDGLFNL